MDGNNMNYQYNNAYQQPVPSQPGKGMGIASMVLGIIALIVSAVACCMPFGYLLASLLGILSIVFGIIAIAKKSGRGMGIAGIICSVVGLLLAIVMLVFSILLGVGVAASSDYADDYDDYDYDYNYDYDDYNYDYDYEDIDWDEVEEMLEEWN